MYITKFQTNDFKNLKNIEFLPVNGVNVIRGENAQGKTNILENIWIMGGCRSFRSRETHLIGFNEPFFETSLKFQNKVREQTISYKLFSDKALPKEIKLNGITLKNSSPLFDEFKCVLFTPDDTELISGSPEKRRWFFDLAAAGLKTSVIRILNRFNSVLSERNGLIKSIKLDVYNGNAKSASDKTLLLDVYDAQLAEAGDKLRDVRESFLKIFAPVCEELYEEISGGRESFKIIYRCGLSSADYLAELKKSRDNDLRLGYTSSGINRDDFLFVLNGKSMRDFASTGQRKSAALILKLAQARLANEITGENPIILLDDVMGELDEKRQTLVSKVIGKMQAFITVCGLDGVKIAPDSVFSCHNGRLITDN